MDKKIREKLVDDIVNSVQGDMCNYEEFALDCVREVVSKWNKEDLCGWFGSEYQDHPDSLIREIE